MIIISISNVVLGESSKFTHEELVNAYDCTIGSNTRVGPFVEIQKNSFIGDMCKISSHTFICEGVHIGNRVFVGHGVVFVNDMFPKSANENGLLSDDDWTLVETHVEDDVSIGSNATILGGIRIGKGSLIGAGAVVTKDVEANSIVVGNPAKVIGKVEEKVS